MELNFKLNTYKRNLLTTFNNKDQSPDDKQIENNIPNNNHTINGKNIENMIEVTLSCLASLNYITVNKSTNPDSETKKSN